MIFCVSELASSHRPLFLWHTAKPFQALLSVLWQSVGPVVFIWLGLNHEAEGSLRHGSTSGKHDLLKWVEMKSDLWPDSVVIQTLTFFMTYQNIKHSHGIEVKLLNSSTLTNSGEIQNSCGRHKPNVPKLWQWKTTCFPKERDCQLLIDTQTSFKESRCKTIGLTVPVWSACVGQTQPEEVRWPCKAEKLSSLPQSNVRCIVQTDCYACQGGCTLHTNPAATQQLCSYITKPDVGNGPGLLGYVP